MELRRPGEWETSEDEDVALMDESWRRLREEIDHIDEHWTDAKKYALVDDDMNMNAELYAIVKHIECISEGLSSIYPTFLHNFCPPRVMAALVRDKLQEQAGDEQVVDIVDVIGGLGVAFSVRDVSDVVPDDLSEMDVDE